MMLKRAILMATAAGLIANPLWSQESLFVTPLSEISFPPLEDHQIDERCGVLFQAMKWLSLTGETGNKEMWQEFSAFFFEMGARRLGKFSVVSNSLPEEMLARAEVMLPIYQESLTIAGLGLNLETLQLPSSSHDQNLASLDLIYCLDRLDAYTDGSLERPI